MFGYGEAPFCLASSPTRDDGLETTVRRVGQLTDALHALSPGDEVGLRGPFGNGFDVDAAHGQDLLFVGGGIGLPPLRGLIWNVLDERDRFGRGHHPLWRAQPRATSSTRTSCGPGRRAATSRCRSPSTAATPGWQGNVGVVPTLFEKVTLRPATTLAFVCGPAGDDPLRGAGPAEAGLRRKRR